MRIYHLSTLAVCSIGFCVKFSGAETSAIYNESCRSEVADFQQSSSSDDVKLTRHALLLCLSDIAYAEETQKNSDYKAWTNTAHFRLFAKNANIEIGDTQVQPVSMFNRSQATVGNGFFSNIGGQCACPTTTSQRSPSDPLGPLKGEAHDAYVTFDLDDVLNGGKEGLDQLQGVIEEMRTQMVAPFGDDQKVAHLIARMADFEGADVGASPAVGAGSSNGILDIYRGAKATLPGHVESTPYAAQTATVSGWGCACQQVLVPIKRSVGDSVPSPKLERPDMFFQIEKPEVLMEALRLNKGGLLATPLLGIQ
jgi:hypothetical protein